MSDALLPPPPVWNLRAATSFHSPPSPPPGISGLSLHSTFLSPLFLFFVCLPSAPLCVLCFGFFNFGFANGPYSGLFFLTFFVKG